MNDIKCNYCGRKANLLTGKELYPHRRDLWAKKFWVCKPCDAWVGCHDGTSKPLGILARREMRMARMEAHAVFDPIWKTGLMGRKDAYTWLAKQLGIKVCECHISRFGKRRSLKVVAVCNQYWAQFNRKKTA